MTPPSAIEPHAELFPHGADIGVRGIGPTRAAAFEQAAVALTMAVTDRRACVARDRRDHLRGAGRPLSAARLAERADLRNGVRRMVFGRFEVSIDGGRLQGRAWGEPSTGRGTRRRSNRRAPPSRPEGRTAGRRHLGRAVHRRRLRQEVTDGPLASAAGVPDRVAARAAGRDARAGGDLRRARR